MILSSTVRKHSGAVKRLPLHIHQLFSQLPDFVHYQIFTLFTWFFISTYIRSLEKVYLVLNKNI